MNVPLLKVTSAQARSGRLAHAKLPIRVSEDRRGVWSRCTCQPARLPVPSVSTRSVDNSIYGSVVYNGRNPTRQGRATPLPPKALRRATSTGQLDRHEASGSSLFSSLGRESQPGHAGLADHTGPFWSPAPAMLLFLDGPVTACFGRWPMVRAPVDEVT